MSQKKNRNGGIGWVVALAFCVYFFLRFLKDSAGDAVYVFFLLLIWAFAIWLPIKTIRINSYMKKHKYHVVFLNKEMNSSYDLDAYYKNRDELIAHLTKMSKDEFLINKNNRLTEKPSSLLKQLAENENLHVHTAILRTTANFKMFIRENGPGISAKFAEQIERYTSRLSPENLHDAEMCIHILRDFEKVAGKIEETDGMDGHEFERWCADLLLKNGFTSAEVTPGSGDQGVDVVAEKDGIRYAIQCKCYTSDLGNTPVQEVYAGKEMYGCQVGVVMTNRYFTIGAKQLAEKTRVLLWDRSKLEEMLGQNK